MKNICHGQKGSIHRRLITLLHVLSLPSKAKRFWKNLRKGIKKLQIWKSTVLTTKGPKISKWWLHELHSGPVVHKRILFGTLITCPTPCQGLCSSPTYLSLSSSPCISRISSFVLGNVKYAILFLFKPMSQRTTMLSWVWR